jgi:hypothetical protein
MAAALVLLLALPAAAQIVTFPRLGASAAADHHDPEITVDGDEVFELHVLVLPPEGETTLGHDFREFEWVLLEPCCGGAAVVLEIDYNPAFSHEGTLLGGMVSTLQEGEACATGEVIRLATLQVQMDPETLPGLYYILAGPFGLAYDCAGEPVVMTDMQLAVQYDDDLTPVGRTSLSEVKTLFR